MAYTNRTYEVDITATGEVAQYNIINHGTPRRSKHISLNIEGDEAASYQVEIGEENENGEIVWFSPDAKTHSSTTSVHHQWTQSETYLRVMVTTAAATAGSTANISVSAGE